MRKAILWPLAAALVGCAAAPDPVATGQVALTDGQINALNNVGRDTGITYQLVDPPEPDLPILGLWFNPVSGLQRVSRYLDLAGGLSQTVTADPPGGATAPGLPQTDILDSAGNVIVTVTGDPPGGAPVSCSAFGRIANGVLNFALTDRTLNFAFGSTTASVIVTADPPGGADPPGSLNFTVQLGGAAQVKVVREGSTSPVCSTSATITPITGGTGG